MFGDLQGMMGKLKETQQKIEETKKRLDTVLVEGTSNQGKIKVTVTANRAVKDIAIDDSLFQDKEQLEDFLILALNDALKKANEINEAEMAAAAKDGMPNIPGLDLFG
ncbi:YbaB/EbfC family nucleoid-associated protein [Aureibaculum sp. 2210JD6-5]|uniref:YbaB/EbfC family nucleoid-associated protein n=1 Tax=Aureibaculum sp. 2210JD6-5 TaxID=3103957 RepID=UPI002AAD958A|nr:YbaB/EbfC family nucleoid-associated protein [Aureibaculum sp. 2210JD6-5]MDY7395298.1 YbaB/EbfC family nucleoid-associated protein [Aureibaculum sp. 2210JD6-5]